MTPANAARITATGIAIAYGIAMRLSQVQLTEQAQSVLAYTPSFAVVLIVAFDAWLWKLPGIQHLFKRPRIEGTWRVVLKPSPESQIPEGGNRGPIVGAMIIEQSFFYIHAIQYTGESSSRSSIAKIRADGESQERWVLVFTYLNQPKQEFRHRSPMHGGTCELHIAGLAATAMSGTYWTNRFTAGDMELELLDRKRSYSSLEEVNLHHGS